MGNENMSEERVRELYESMLDYLSELIHPYSEAIDTLHRIGFTKKELIDEGFDGAEDFEFSDEEDEEE